MGTNRRICSSGTLTTDPGSPTSVKHRSSGYDVGMDVSGVTERGGGLKPHLQDAGGDGQNRDGERVENSHGIPLRGIPFPNRRNDFCTGLMPVGPLSENISSAVADCTGSTRGHSRCSSFGTKAPQNLGRDGNSKILSDSVCHSPLKSGTNCCTSLMGRDEESAPNKGNFSWKTSEEISSKEMNASSRARSSEDGGVVVGPAGGISTSATSGLHHNSPQSVADNVETTRPVSEAPPLPRGSLPQNGSRRNPTEMSVVESLEQPRTASTAHSRSNGSSDGSGSIIPPPRSRSSTKNDSNSSRPPRLPSRRQSGDPASSQSPPETSRKAPPRLHTMRSMSTGCVTGEPLSGDRGAFALSSAVSTSHLDSSGSGPDAAIHDAARVLDWPAVKRGCQENPIDASYKGFDDWTALHQTTGRRPPADVVESLVNAYPDAVFCQDTTKGMSPLHYACRFKASKEVVMHLLRGAAESVKTYPGRKGAPVNDEREAKKRKRYACQLKCKIGRTPLYYAMRYDAPDEVMEMLLEAYPLAAIVHDRKANTPLSLVWDDFATTLAGKRSLMAFYEKVEGQNGSSSTHEGELECHREQCRRLHLLKADKKLFSKLQKADVLLRAAHYGCLQWQQTHDTESWAGAEVEFKADSRPFRHILHASANVSCRCNPTLWGLVRCIFGFSREHLIEKDDILGRTPLHYAASCVACNATRLCGPPLSGTFDLSCSLAPSSQEESGAAPAPPTRTRSGLWVRAPSFSRSLSGQIGNSNMPTPLGGPTAVGVPMERPSLVTASSTSSVGGSTNALGSSPVSATFSAEAILNDLIESCLDAAKFGDVNGRTPLALALENTCHSFSWHKKGGDQPEEGSVASPKNDTEDRGVSCDPCRWTVDEEGMKALVPDDGVIQKLINLAPQVLYSRDRKTCLYPFMMAALKTKRVTSPEGSIAVSREEETEDEELARLTTVYRLLRGLPEVIML